MIREQALGIGEGVLIVPAENRPVILGPYRHSLVNQKDKNQVMVSWYFAA